MMLIILRWIVLCFVFCLCSCRQTVTSVHVPNHWPHAKEIATKKIINLSKTAWWKQFHDARLNQILSCALKNNNDLNISIQKIYQAQAELKTVQLSWIPGFPIIGGFSQLPIYGNPGTFLIAAPDYLLNILQFYQKQKAAHAKMVASVHVRNAVRLSVIYQVISSYMTLLSDHEAFFLIKNLIKNLEIKLQLEKQRFRSGIVSMDSILMTERTIHLMHARLAKIKEQIVKNENILHYLMNENPGEITTHQKFSKLNDQLPIPLHAPLCIIENRPDIQESQFHLLEMKHQYQASIAELFPNITLGGFFGYGRYMDGPINAPNATISLNNLIPALYGHISYQHVSFQKARVQYIRTVKRALKDIDTDLMRLGSDAKQLQEIDEAYQNIKNQCRLNAKRSQYGIASDLQLLDCRIEQYQLALVKNQRKLYKMLSINQLFNDLAVGYHAT